MCALRVTETKLIIGEQESNAKRKLIRGKSGPCFFSKMFKRQYRT